MKETSGYVYKDANKIWYARITFTEKNGKRKDIKRRVENRAKGNKILAKLIEQVENQNIDADRMRFNDLCDYYAKHYLSPPHYVNARKVSGLRSHVTVSGYVRILREHFKRQLLRTITYEDLRMFRNLRLKTPTQQSAQRSLTTVNREMAYLRRMLNIAERNDWIRRNPFKSGDALIHIADEVKRERIITREEELRLLAACVGRRAHLRPIIIAALDTGCRLGELLKLRWHDVDVKQGVITIQAFNTKTMKERQVSITTRLNLEFEHMTEKHLRRKEQNSNRQAVGDSDLVFGITDIRQGFHSICKEAKLPGLRMHDLRHTHATRLDDLGFSLAKIGGQLGHTVVQTTLRYVNRDKASILQVGIALDNFQAGA